MHDNFEHFILEDLFKEDLLPLDSAINTQSDFTSLQNTKCSIIKPTWVLKEFQTTPVPPTCPYIQIPNDKQSAIQMDTQRGIQTNSHPMTASLLDSPPSTDPFSDDTFFFDDVIEDEGLKLVGDLLGYHGDGGVCKEEKEENSVWGKMEDILEDDGDFVNDVGKHGDMVEDGGFGRMQMDEGLMGGFHPVNLCLQESPQILLETPILHLGNIFSGLNNLRDSNAAFNGVVSNNIMNDNNNDIVYNNYVNYDNENVFSELLNEDADVFSPTSVNNLLSNRTNNNANISIIRKNSNSTTNKNTTATNLNNNNILIKKGIKRKMIAIIGDEDDDDDDDCLAKREYLEKRVKNNQSVRKCREKSRRRHEDMERRVGALVAENEALHGKVDEMEKEVAILKRLLSEMINK